MKTLTALILIVTLFVEGKEFHNTISAATIVFAENSPKAISKKETLDKLSDIFTIIERYRGGDIPSKEDAISLNELLTEVKVALKSKSLAPEEVAKAYSKKPWFFALLKSIKALEESEKALPEEMKSNIGWMTAFWLAEALIDAKAFWYMLTPESIDKMQQEDLRSTLRKLRVVRSIREKHKPEYSRAYGTFGWLDDIVSKAPGDFIKNFPKPKEIDAMSAAIEKRLQQMAPTAPKPTPNNENEKGNDEGGRPLTRDDIRKLASF